MCLELILFFLTVIELVTGATWSELMPWATGMPEQEYKDHIEIRLVKKAWLPQGMSVPASDAMFDSYSGTIAEAYEIFRNAPVYEYHKTPFSKAMELLTSEFGYDSSLETIVIIHTISGNANGGFVQNTVAALGLRNAIKSYNIITVNMPELRTVLHQTGVQGIFGRVENYEALGRSIGGLFNEAIQQSKMAPGQLHFIGFSLSSQLCGYIARHISSKNGGKKVASIMALDPNAIGLFPLVGQPVSARDAQVVQAFHTNSLVMGSTYRRATADFVFNTGYAQPGCQVTDYMCSHRKAVLILWYVILYKELFVARSCGSYLLFSTCLCQSHDTVQISYPPTNKAKGVYYLRARPHKPYGYGPASADCPPKACKDNSDNEHPPDTYFVSNPL